MAHIHQEQIVINISKLAKGELGECCEARELTQDTIDQLEAVVRELLDTPGLVVEVKHSHD